MEFPTQFEDLAPVSCIGQDLFTLEQGVFKGVGVGGGACTFLYNVDVGPRRDATKVPCGNNDKLSVWMEYGIFNVPSVL